MFHTESFWVDLVLCNPLDVEVNLSNLTVAVEESEPDGSSSSKGGIEVEVAEEVILGPRESRTVSLTANPISRLNIDFRPDPHLCNGITTNFADYHARHIRFLGSSALY